ncbi:MAG: DUF167 domain-containing protein [Planctomycetes bacterium]|nr:DUF167 domain-containing protein [Planctomycetota bacterium]MBU1517859.1 DUF167 domain-containing protein [Planctomycetota bacterium]MBU2457995.1 DUF167 domain-containing protein [Planctomycetota bacterium]MBU2596267.1 DUF167 domain-containing protein [Planctomycetota bacterium]
MSNDTLNITKKDDQFLFNVKVAPGSSRTEIAGIYNGMLKVRLCAAPEKGKANQALIKLLSGKLDVPKKEIAITAGLTSKVKQVSVKNITQKTIDAILSDSK